MVISNDNTPLVPRTTFDAPTLTFEFPALHIGVAEYDEGPTGCTVFYFPEGVKTAVDLRGGFEISSGDYSWCNAICLAGGSVYGLEAAAGVQAELFARLDYSLDFETFPLVNGSIIYDFGSLESRIYPDAALGRAALRAAQTGIFPLGARGVGRSASVGSAIDDDWSESSGQGGAFRQVGATKIAVFIVVNSSGVVHDRAGKVVRGNCAPTGERLAVIPELERRIAEKLKIQPRIGNSTSTVVVTNQKLDTDALRQLARQVHASLARVIQPFHTVDDNDVLYAVTTGEIEREWAVTTIGMLASELLWDAVLSIPATL